jgi:hypothetical protein
MYAMHYASMLRCWQLVKILVRTNHPCLRVGCHTKPLTRPKGALPMEPCSATDGGLPCLSLVSYPECATG